MHIPYARFIPLYTSLCQDTVNMRMNMEMSATNVRVLLDLSTHILVSVATLDIDWLNLNATKVKPS